MDFYEVLEKRRTYRDFSDREVSDEILKRVIGAAFKAPTNDHLRQLEFVVVRSRENIAKVIAPLAENMAAFKELVAEVDESGDKDKMAMFADALPKQHGTALLVCSVSWNRSDADRVGRRFTAFLFGNNAHTRRCGAVFGASSSSFTGNLFSGRAF